MGTPWYKRYSQVQETDLGRVPEWGAPGTKSAACARLTLVQVNLMPALLPACRFQRGSQPSQIVRIRDGFQDLGKKATSTPCLPTWPALSIFRILGFFSIVPQAAGATGSQATCGDIAGLPKPFHGRLGFPGSQCRDVEPTATVLTAGSTKRSPPPHHYRTTHCGRQNVQAQMLTFLCNKMAGIRWECNWQGLSHTSVRSPVQFPRYYDELFDEIGNCR